MDWWSVRKLKSSMECFFGFPFYFCCELSFIVFYLTLKNHALKSFIFWKQIRVLIWDSYDQTIAASYPLKML